MSRPEHRNVSQRAITNREEHANRTIKFTPRTEAQKLLESDGWFYRTNGLGTDDDGRLFWFDGDQRIYLGKLVTCEDMVPDELYGEYVDHLDQWSDAMKFDRTDV